MRTPFYFFFSKFFTTILLPKKSISLFYLVFNFYLQYFYKNVFSKKLSKIFSMNTMNESLRTKIFKKKRKRKRKIAHIV